MVSFAGLLLALCLCIMTFRSRAENSPQNESSASRSTNTRHASTTIHPSGIQGTTNFANASISNNSVEHSAKDSVVTRTYNIWVKNSTDVKGNNAILKTLRGFSLSPDQDIMCSQLGSGLTDVNFFTTVLTSAQASEIGNLTKASNAINPQSLEHRASDTDLVGFDNNSSRAGCYSN